MPDYEELLESPVAGTRGDVCSVVCRYVANDRERVGYNPRDYVGGVLTDQMEIRSAFENMVVVDFGDRVWYKRPIQILQHIRATYALRLIDNGFDTQEAEEEAINQSKAIIFSSGEDRDDENELGIEVTFTKELSEKEFQQSWSEHITNPDSINDIFPQRDRKASGKTVLLSGQSGEVTIDKYERAINEFMEDFSVVDMKVVCRPLQP